MSGVDNKVWSRRHGLFAKYVVSLVGLVVFVLAVNGVTETWINYRATKAGLIDALAERADATAKRIDLALSDLQRQVSSVTRPSTTKEDRQAEYAQLLTQASAITQLYQIDSFGREQLRLSRTSITKSAGTELLHDPRFTEAITRGVSFSPVNFKGSRPTMS